jgi:pimeloyl-ACP methyl ester carboxylesterase
LHHRHPELVARIVGLDVAPHLAPTPREAAFIVAYQWWLLAAFVAGGPIGDAMTRRMARLAHSPRQGAAIDSGVNYPYLYTWRDIVTGRALKALQGYAPTIPILFVYGERKPARFHSDRWLRWVRRYPTNRVVALEDRDHWVTRDPELAGIIRGWLDGKLEQRP